MRCSTLVDGAPPPGPGMLACCHCSTTFSGARVCYGRCVGVLGSTYLAICAIHCLFFCFHFLNISYLLLNLEIGMHSSKRDELLWHRPGDCRGPSVPFMMCHINSDLSF